MTQLDAKNKDRSQQAQQVLDLLTPGKSLTTGEIAEALGITPNAASTRCYELCQAGAAWRKIVDGRFVYQRTPEGSEDYVKKHYQNLADQKVLKDLVKSIDKAGCLVTPELRWRLKEVKRDVQKIITT